MATEIEIKLAARPGDLVRLPRLALVRRHAAGLAVRRRLANVYFDTPDFALSRAGIAVRVRRVGRKSLQTVKSEDARGAGLRRRAEVEEPVAGETPDWLHLARRAGLPLLAEPAICAAVRPLFRTDFERTTWELHWPDGSRIELARDIGAIQAAGSSEPICEIELELLEGSEVALREAALELSRALRLHLEPRSKAQRGYDRLRGMSPQPATAEPVPLASDCSVEDAFCLLAGAALVQVERNVPAILLDRDPEGVHQARVALRRFRACIRAFERALPRDAWADLRPAMRDTGRALGAVRDLDVFCAESLPAMARDLPDLPVARLLRAARRRRVAALRALRVVLAGDATPWLLAAGLRLQTRDWRSAGGARHSRRLDPPVATVAARMLARAARRMRRCARGIRSADEAALHELRIAAKECRYVAEFLAPLFDAECVAPYLRALRRLQDALGSLQDATVARERLAGLSRELRALAEPDADDWARFVRGVRRRAVRRWRNLCGVPAFWESSSARG